MSFAIKHLSLRRDISAFFRIPPAGKFYKAESEGNLDFTLFPRDGIIKLFIALDGEVLEGDFPRNKLKLVEAWMTLHEDELNANWKLLSEGDGYFKIQPLI